jgi:hypothetical protein
VGSWAIARFLSSRGFSRTSVSPCNDVTLCLSALNVTGNGFTATGRLPHISKHGHYYIHHDPVHTRSLEGLQEVDESHSAKKPAEKGFRPLSAIIQDAHRTGELKYQRKEFLSRE